MYDVIKTNESLLFVVSKIIRISEFIPQGGADLYSNLESLPAGLGRSL